MSEILEVVDENNNVIGREERNIIYEKGLYHRASHIFLINSSGKILLLKRSSKKKIFPLHWDIVVAEHLKVGESYEEGALRGLKEELGVVDVKIVKLDGPTLRKTEFGKLKEYEFRILYKAVYNNEVKAERDEIEEAGFFTFTEAEEILRNEKTVPWFGPALDYIKKNLK